MGTSFSSRSLVETGGVIAPSLLAADFARLADEIQRLEAAGARVLHLDIMDGHFVPNLSFGLPVVEAIRGVTDLPLDVHLMISDPGRYLRAFRSAGADLLTVHIEVVPDPTEILGEIRDLGAGPGLSWNPPTPADAILPYVSLCDLILTMSVMPGFGGQRFDPVALEKLRLLRERVQDGVLLSVDGGVNEETITQCAEAGANYFVTGTALFEAEDYRARLQQLEALAAPRGIVRDPS